MSTLMPKPAALIFDMDGTLLDTEPLYSIAIQKVLDPYKVEYTLALKQQCMGGDSRRSAAIVIEHFELPLSIDDYLETRAVYLKTLFENAEEIGGAGNFIHQLAKSDLSFGLATSSHEHLYRLKLEGRSWGDLFHQVICGDNPALKNGKPAPDIFLMCAAALGVEPSQCIAFEDSANGVKAAKDAGMQVIAINSPYIAEGALDDAELIIDHFDELLPLLAGWRP